MKLSIITINYNNLHGLQKTIASVVAQTCKDFEWIVIDGGSTDGSKELIEQHQEHFSYWCSEPDKGIYNAMNKGIVQADGDYCLFLNSGDKLHSTVVVEYIEKELYDTDFVAGDTWLVDDEYRFVSEKKSPSFISKYYLLEMALCHQGLFIRTDLLKERPYDESLRIVADWEQTFYEILIKGRTYKHIERIVSDYQVGGISEKNDLQVIRERKMVRDLYYTPQKQDEIMLSHFFFEGKSQSMYKLTEIAYTAFVNKCYSQQEYVRTFNKYKEVILTHGAWHQRFFILMCLNGCMKMARNIYHLIK